MQRNSYTEHHREGTELHRDFSENLCEKKHLEYPALILDILVLSMATVSLRSTALAAHRRVKQAFDGSRSKVHDFPFARGDREGSQWFAVDSTP
jgi:hypothetical protein